MSSAQWNDPNTAEGEDISSSVVSYTKESLEIIQKKTDGAFIHSFFPWCQQLMSYLTELLLLNFQASAGLKPYFLNLFITNPQFHEIKDFWIIH